VTHPAGWYDDPQDPSRLRYWDGVSWTEHSAPKQPAPQAAYGPPGQGAPAPGQLAHGQPAHSGPAPYAGGYGYPAGFGYGGTQAPVTPDGTVLSGWWRRVLARVIDGLILNVISLPLTWYFLSNYFKVVLAWERDLIHEAEAGNPRFTATLPAEAYQWMLPAVAIGLAVGLVYELLFLTRNGATPGKRVAGISVRLREVPGPPPAIAVLKRCGVYYGLSLGGVVPYVGSLFGLTGLLNQLWPLWDKNRQALHDKVAETNVVMGRQSRR